MKKFVIACWIILALGAGGIFAPSVAAQEDSPGRDKPVKPVVKRPSGNIPPKTVAKPCIEGEIIVRCGMPGCDISLDHTPRGTTNSMGELRIPAPRGKHEIIASKTVPRER